ncbi:TcdA/TcdB pore-forming domain-containing protein [Chitinimonas sp. BJB300]|uniref:TcdA/TcdB pore-forming domain-containing protein n=2 Tax=Chitinimonas sp. BJB300 TaxID=1559339 RepID=UPI0011124F2B|nr:TcdA/TcdB pore-forming domain-containing protein [Chitinimonas sp. BJB300]TSJ87762.1 hypothetical protein FG002_012535 [Chitinimonas sp. BJB300]
MNGVEVAAIVTGLDSGLTQGRLSADLQAKTMGPAGEDVSANIAKDSPNLQQCDMLLLGHGTQTNPSIYNSQAQFIDEICDIHSEHDSPCSNTGAKRRRRETSVSGLTAAALPPPLSNLSIEDKIANYILAIAFSNEHIEVGVARPLNKQPDGKPLSNTKITERKKIFEERVVACVGSWQLRQNQQLRIQSYIEGTQDLPNGPTMAKGWSEISELRMDTVAVVNIDRTLYVAANFKTRISNVNEDNTVRTPSGRDNQSFSIQEDKPGNRVAILDQLYTELGEEAPFDKVVFVEMARAPTNLAESAAPHAEMQLLSYLKAQGKNLAGVTFGISKPACTQCKDVLANSHILFRTGVATGESANSAPKNWLSLQQIDEQGGVLAKYETFTTHGALISDYRAVTAEQWRKPSPSQLTRLQSVATSASRTGTPPKPYVIIQLDGDPIGFHAAHNQYLRYPADQVRWLQWNASLTGPIVDAVSRQPYTELPNTNGASLFLVGHTTQSNEMDSGGVHFAGLSAKRLVTKLFSANPANRLPSQISLLGIELAQAGFPSLSENFTKQLALSIARHSPTARLGVAARDTLVRINAAGRRETLRFMAEGHAVWKTGDDSNKTIVMTDGKGGITVAPPRQAQWESAITDPTVLLTDTIFPQPALTTRDRLTDMYFVQLSLQKQEADRIAGVFRRAATHFIPPSENQPGQLIPLLHTLKEEPNGRYSIDFGRRQPPYDIVRYSGSDPGFIEAKRYIDRLNQAISAANDSEDVTIDGIGITAAFAFQALITNLNDQDQTLTADRTPSTSQNLALAVRIHDYVNTAQMGQAALQDINSLGRLVNSALRAENSLFPFGGAASKFLTGTGIGLHLASIGLDIYELSQACSEQQKAIFGTRLAFDSAGLAVMGTSLLGEGIAAFTTPAGVLLAGLGVGISALVKTFSDIAQNAEEVGQHFAQLKAAYSTQTGATSGGYHYDADKQLLVPMPFAVIETLDLKNRRTTFSSPMLYRSHHGITGSGYINYFFWAGDMPTSVHDRGQALNIRNRLGINSEATLPANSNLLGTSPGATMLLLPATPQYYIDYRYNLLPGATTKHLFSGADHGFNILRKLEEKYDFDFDFYIFPSEQIIEKIFIEYVSTDIKLILDNQIRNIQMPMLPNNMHGHLHYTLQAQSGQYVVGLQPGSRLTLKSDEPANTKWVLDARGLPNRDIVFGTGTLSIGGITLSLPDNVAPQQISVIKQDDQIVRLDLGIKREKPITNVIDATQLKQRGENLNSQLQTLARQHMFASDYVEVLHYVPPTPDGQPTQPTIPRAYYDVEKGRYLYAKGYPDAVLVTQSGSYAYFYDRLSIPHQVLQVDINSGEIRTRYCLPSNTGSLTVWQEMGVVCLAANLPGDQGAATYRIIRDTLELVRVRASTALLAQLSTNNVPDLAVALRPYLAGVQSIATDSPTPRQADLPQEGFVVVDHFDPQMTLQQRYWLRSRDGAVIKPIFNPSLQNNASSRLTPIDLTLVNSGYRAEDGSEVFDFYSAKEKLVYRQKRSQSMVWHEYIHDTPQVSVVNGQLYLITQEGLVKQFDTKSNYTLTAVTQSWLKHHPAWWQDLKTLSETDNTLSVLDIKRSDDTALSVWLKEDIIVIADPNLPRTLQLLGLDVSKQYAWLYDANSATLYKQPLLDNAGLSQAFGQGTKLLADTWVPAAKSTSFPGLSLLGNTLSVQNETSTLPPLIRGITQLVVSPRTRMQLTLDSAQWAHYQNVVVDLSHVNETSTGEMKISLTMPTPHTLQTERLGDDWIIAESSSDKSLVLKNAYSVPNMLNTTATLILPGVEQRERALNPLYEILK